MKTTSKASFTAKNLISALYFLSFILISIQNKAQYPSLEGYVVSNVSTVEFWYENCFLNSSCYDKKDKVKAEIPPCIIGGDWRSYFMVDGINTYIWSSPKSIIDNTKIDFKNNAVGPATVSSPYTNSSNFSRSSNIENWKRNYHSVYSAHYFIHPTQGPISIGILHGENKNISRDCNSDNLLNTINPNIAINCNDHNTWSGGNPYQDGWLAYHSMVSVAWTYNNQSTNWGQQFFNNQLGPVSWPANGYIASDNRIATCGHSHPSSIMANGYMYIFYSDAGPWGDHIPLEEGRLKGIKVLRVLQSEILDPNKYEVYYKDLAGNVNWLKSLPSGFTKDNMLQYARVKGPKSTDVLNNINSDQTIRFSVAKVRNTDYFIGIEEYIDNIDRCSSGAAKYKLALRFSNDLINWGDRVKYVTTPKCWEEHNMRFPIFLDKSGWNNYEIDLDEFYILGTAGINKGVNKIKVYKGTITRPTQYSLSDTIPLVNNHDFLFSDSELAKEKIIISPNPASKFINIQMEIEEKTNFQAIIYNINGVLLKTINEPLNKGVYNKKINLNGFQKGLYIIKIIKNNKFTYSKFIVL